VTVPQTDAGHPPLLEVCDLTRRFGGVLAVDRVTFTVAPQEIVAIIGPNGAGKTTVFNMITGLLRPTAGEVRYRGKRLTGLLPERIAALGIVRTFQNLMTFSEMTVAENVMVGCHRWTRTGLLHAAFALPAALREDDKSPRPPARVSRVSASRGGRRMLRGISRSASSAFWRPPAHSRRARPPSSSMSPRAD